MSNKKLMKLTRLDELNLLVWLVEKLCMLCMPVVAMVTYICMLVARLNSRVVSNLFLDMEHQQCYWRLGSTLQPVEVP